MEDSLNTAYDDAFRTMIEKCDDLVIPFLNYMFGEHFTENDQIIRTSNEEFSQKEDGVIKKRITDSQLTIVSEGIRKRYHVECESSVKTGSVLVRVFEYGAMMALDDAKLSEDELELVVDFPHTGVLLLRSGELVPNTMRIRIITPNGEGCSYQVPVMKESDFSLKDIFDNKLYFLIPFYLFNYEKNLGEIDNDEKLMLDLLKEYNEIAEKLDCLVETGNLFSRSRYVIIQMIKRVADKLAMKHNNVKQKVGGLMGGHVIDLDIFQAEDKAEARGKAIGKTMGADMLASLLRILAPGSSEYEAALNGPAEVREELFKKYNIG